jgi:hypothetical protein
MLPYTRRAAHGHSQVHHDLTRNLGETEERGEAHGRVWIFHTVMKANVVGGKENPWRGGENKQEGERGVRLCESDARVSALSHALTPNCRRAALLRPRPKHTVGVLGRVHVGKPTSAYCSSTAASELAQTGRA